MHEVRLLLILFAPVGCGPNDVPGPLTPHQPWLRLARSRACAGLWWVAAAPELVSRGPGQSRRCVQPLDHFQCFCVFVEGEFPQPAHAA